MPLAACACLSHLHDGVARAARVDVCARRRPAPPAVGMVDALPKTNEAVMMAASRTTDNGVPCACCRLADMGCLHLLSFQRQSGTPTTFALSASLSAWPDHGCGDGRGGRAPLQCLA